MDGEPATVESSSSAPYQTAEESSSSPILQAAVSSLFTSSHSDTSLDTPQPYVLAHIGNNSGQGGGGRSSDPSIDGTTDTSSSHEKNDEGSGERGDDGGTISSVSAATAASNSSPNASSSTKKKRKYPPKSDVGKNAADTQKIQHRTKRGTRTSSTSSASTPGTDGPSVVLRCSSRKSTKTSISQHETDSSASKTNNHSYPEETTQAQSFPSLTLTDGPSVAGPTDKHTIQLPNGLTITIEELRERNRPKNCQI